MNKKIFFVIAIICFSFVTAYAVSASTSASGEAKQNRGLYAFLLGNDKDIQVSWRMRSTDDPKTTTYELYADNKLVYSTTTKTTARIPNKYKGKTLSLVVKDAKGNVIDTQAGAKVAENCMLDIPLSKHKKIT